MGKLTSIGALSVAIALSSGSFASAQSENQNQTQNVIAGTWRINTGVNYSSGDYGDVRDTVVISTPVGLRFSSESFSVRLSLPYVYIEGPGSLLDAPQGRDAGGGGGDDSGGGSSNSGSGSSNSGSGSSGGDVNTGDASVTADRRSGIGDASAAFTYSLDLGNELYADMMGRVKLPTASRGKRIGTGEVDFTAGLDLIKEFGMTTAYFGGRRKFTGRPDVSTLRDAWGFSSGVSLRASNAIAFGADYDWQQSTVTGNTPSSEVTGWTSFRLAEALRMQLYATTGLTTNSADFAGGMSISYSFR